MTRTPFALRGLAVALASCFRPTPIIKAANEELAANEAISPGSFTIEQPDGFTIKYGKYPHKVGMQIFDKAAAVAMANDVSSLLGKASRLFRGIPVYAGHPDHPDLAQRNRFTDSRARGWIKEVIPGENEARFIVSYNELGRGEVQDAQWAGYSPLWLMVAAENTGHQKSYRPVRLQSFGLTNNPNIDVTPIVAANEEGKMDEEPAAEPTGEPAPETMISRIRAALTNEGLIKPEDSDEMILGVLGNLFSSMAWERQRKAEMEQENTRMELLAKAASCAENEKAPLVILDAALARLATLAANESAANDQVQTHSRARQILATRLLDDAITAAIITPPQRDAINSEILGAANESDLQAVLAKLKKPAASPSTTLLSKQMTGARNHVLAANDAEGRNRLRTEAVDAVLQEITKGGPAKKGDHEKAWTIAQSRKPELFTH